MFIYNGFYLAPEFYIRKTILKITSPVLAIPLENYNKEMSSNKLI